MWWVGRVMGGERVVGRESVVGWSVLGGREW